MPSYVKYAHLDQLNYINMLRGSFTNFRIIFIRYWSDRPEIYTQDVKFKKKTFLVLVTFSDWHLVFFIYIYIYIYI